MATDRVVVRWLEVGTVDEARWPRLEAMLDDDERRRADRFRFDRDRRGYVAAHALGRRLLSDWAGGAPADWRFAVGDHGKPEAVMPPGAPRLRLNLSHTNNLVAAALAAEYDVGVDVEWLDRRPAVVELARRFFAPAECRLVEAAPPAAAIETFLALWTLKEAYVKAIGKGLAQPLDSFAFTLDPPSIRFDDPHAGDGGDWLFRRCRPTAGHLLALALKPPRPAAVAVDMAAIDAAALCP